MNEPITHIEMIIDYTTDGTDYQYCDNKGVLIRCGECKHLFVGDPLLWCNRTSGVFSVTKDDYCSFAVKEQKE